MNLRAACRNWVVFAAFAFVAGGSCGAEGDVAPGVSHAETRVVDLRIVARKPEGGARTVRAIRGERIVLQIHSDEGMTVHIHGYDVRHDVTPGSLAKMAFVARWVGRFPVTAHLPGGPPGTPPREATLLYLEVHPQ